MKHIELLNDDVRYLETYTQPLYCDTCDSDGGGGGGGGCGCNTYVCGADVCGCDGYVCGCNIACDDFCTLINY